MRVARRVARRAARRAARRDVRHRGVPRPAFRTGVAGSSWLGRATRRRAAARFVGCLLLALTAACSGGAPAARVSGTATAGVPATVPASTTPASPAVPSGTSGGTRLHYVSNTHGDTAAAAKLGYNLFDMGPDKSAIDALGPGQRALVWLGNLDNTNCQPGYSWARFTAAVDRLAGDPKVFGYYLSDEPHPSICPDAVAHIRARADYIRARDPHQVSFIVVLGSSTNCGPEPGCEYSQLKPANSHVDLIGVDVFPCNVNSGCRFDKIDVKVGQAVANGIPAPVIVPVFQAFGQVCNTEQSHYYVLPTQPEMREQLGRWAALVPHPVFDFAYTWRSVGPACPALDAADGTQGRSDLQSVLREHNGA